MTGLLLKAIMEGALAATPEQEEDASIAHIEERSLQLFLAAKLLEVTELLRQRAVQCRVLKGWAVASLDYPEPALRSFGDIDLLVRTEQFDDVVGGLYSVGFIRGTEEPQPGFDRRFGKGVTLRASSGYELDLHRTLALPPFGLMVHMCDLWAAYSTFSLAGSELQALDLEGRFLHACFHAALGVPTRLVPLRDVAHIATKADLDAARVISLASKWRTEAVVASAMRLAWRRLRLSETCALSQWAAHYRTTRWEQLALDFHRNGSRHRIAPRVAALHVMHGALNRFAFAGCMLKARAGHTTRLFRGI